MRRIIRTFIANFLRIPFFTPVLSTSNGWVGSEEEVKNLQLVNFVPFGMTVNEVQATEHIESLNAGNLKLLSVGKFQRRKNHLETFKALLSNESFISSLSTFEIIGEMTTTEHIAVINEIREFVALNGVEKKIVISTNLSHPDVLAKIQMCDVFVMLSSREPASISNLEAMSFGKPVIIKSKNGTANYLNNGKGGFIVNSIEEFSEKLNSFYQDPNSLLSCGQENISAVKNFMDPVASAIQILKISGYLQSDSKNHD
jgi:glycosyltransferase involved in cell wall biosynthesis